MANAKAFLQSNKAKRFKMLKSTCAMTKNLTVAEKGNADAFYVFNIGDNEGFVIASANDQTNKILGYSDHGQFDFSNLPPNFKYVLENYAKQIASISSETKFTSATSSKTAIEPLIATHWNQSYPYNLLCPKDNETGDYSYVGCVAVAIAQILNYHRWPDIGQDNNSYEWNGTTYATDFSSVFFQWDKMQATYDNDDNAYEVAYLMYYCALAAETQFSSYASSGYISDFTYTKYFGYSDDVKFVYKSDVTSSEFEELIYSDLSRGLPVEYGGQSDDGVGHAFICDGYDGKGYYHFNFGWGGDSDGYFLLSAINTDNGDWNADQYILCNIHRPYEALDIDGVVYEMNGYTNAKVVGCNDTCLNIKDEVTMYGVTLPVTEIAAGAFKNDSNFNSVYIPASITTIGSDAFTGAAYNNFFTVDENNPNFTSEDGVLFNKDMTRLISYPSKKISYYYTIPSTVTELAPGAFYDIIGITDLYLQRQQPPICGVDALNGVKDTAIVHIPAETLETYQSTYGWNEIKKYDEEERVDEVSEWYMLTNDAKYILVSDISCLLAVDDEEFFAVVGEGGKILADTVYFAMFTQDAPAVTGLNNLTIEERNILPTPVNNEISLEGVQGTLSIITTSGVEVMRQESSNGRVSVNVSTLPTGVYIAKIGKSSVKFFKRKY